jgi:DNA-binding transcriptional MerR regulator
MHHQTAHVPGDFYIVPAEAARLLGTTARELRALADGGTLHRVRITPGGHRRYNLREVLQVRAARREGSTP